MKIGRVIRWEFLQNIRSKQFLIITILIPAIVGVGIFVVTWAMGDEIQTASEPPPPLIIGMLIMIPLIVPAMAALFPGEPALWVKVLPTYGLVQTVIDASAGGLSWADAAGALAAMAAWGVGLLILGAWTLNRRVARL